ncbi:MULTISPECIES: IS30 family transposase [unclassified Ruegeria]|uniref:IS30 family transposase n=1 Tax=unclassified Ruegeria TaxID=2625375 RepID=UPI001489D5DA|nr:MULTISPECIES: IS30 family transposase [unclassified Ruegeria]
MAYRRRIYFTDQQKAEIWDRWQRGESMSSIGRLFDRNSSSIYPLLARTGGIRPPERRRSRLAMTLAEREEISRGLKAKLSFRSIARQLRRAPSTISREVRRNGGRRVYRAASADLAAWDRAKRPKPCKLAGQPQLCQTIAEKLVRKWSPQQIAGWLKREHPNDEGARVSHETIYRSLFIQARGVLKKELLAHLRATRAIRRSRHASLKRDGLGQIKDAISIRERPAAVEDRAIPGHWEGDLIAGSKNSFIATLVERRTRYVMLAKVGGKETQTVVAALTAQVQHLPRELRQTLTWDRGKELADHKSLTLATDLDIYFCDPHSPWQRGTNENTNRLLRQYFPKGTDLSVHTQEHLDTVARELNERPRKTLNYFSPAEKFQECVAAIS